MEVAERTERPQPVVGVRGDGDEADHLDTGAGAVRQGMGDIVDLAPGADEQGPALVPRPRQQPARQSGVQMAQDADVHRGEDERSVEDVVAGEVLALGDGEHQ